MTVKTVTKTTTKKTTAAKTTAKKATVNPTTVVAPHPGAEVAVTSPLRARVAAHRPQFTIDAGTPVVLAACNGKRGKSYSYGYAKTHGVVLCRKCFGGNQ